MTGKFMVQELFEVFCVESVVAAALVLLERAEKGYELLALDDFRQERVAGMGEDVEGANVCFLPGECTADLCRHCFEATYVEPLFNVIYALEREVLRAGKQSAHILWADGEALRKVGSLQVVFLHIVYEGEGHLARPAQPALVRLAPFGVLHEARRCLALVCLQKIQCLVCHDQSSSLMSSTKLSLSKTPLAIR